MTIILAAYCDEGTCGVIGADRMSVRGTGTSAAQRDDSVRKIVELTTSMVLANTGYVFDAKYVEDMFRKLGEHKGRSVSEVCRFVSKTLAELQTQKRDAEVERLLGGAFTYQSLAEVCGKGTGGLFLDAFKAAHDLNYGEFLMVGFEEGQVTIRCDPSPQTLGVVEVDYVATGSGYHYAHAAMTIANHTKATDLETAMFNVYSGIKAAAVSYGVGKIIDMAIVSSHGVRFVSQRVLDTLENVLAAKSLTDDEKRRIEEAMNEEDTLGVKGD